MNNKMKAKNTNIKKNIQKQRLFEGIDNKT